MSCRTTDCHHLSWSGASLHMLHEFYTVRSYYKALQGDWQTRPLYPKCAVSRIKYVYRSVARTCEHGTLLPRLRHKWGPWWQDFSVHQIFTSWIEAWLSVCGYVFFCFTVLCWTFNFGNLVLSLCVCFMASDLSMLWIVLCKIWHVYWSRYLLSWHYI